MAARPVLADSSYYLGLMRAGRDPLRALALAAAARDIAVCGVIRCEVGRGLRDSVLRQRFQNSWDVMINVPTDHRLWSDVEQILWDLDRKGVVIPLTDAVIACCAMRIRAILLTYDHHFEHIPGLQTARELQE
ncbi:MAG TPA: PIN domain-containing protein [Candidatus Paceibacterota bacterium]|nr:PIN domain-containing protein [Verrucomicrobiota bacterium]HRY49396.1 PIN domain-containing protein [Candidatus Paceibacterota bacterium]HSA01473.1 PIN domain-containing protein [Candidatus Paceibacterota bacterium]